MTTLAKLDPRYDISLQGFDRRGAAASINNASATGFTVSGRWGDLADFAVLYLRNADDLYGHLFTSRYLPDFSLAGVTLDFDLALTGCMNPTSAKYQSVPWGNLSYITSAEVEGTPVALPAPTTTTGAAAASGSFTVAGTPTAWDRVQLIYLSNVVFEVIVGQTYNSVVVLTLAQIATELARQVNVDGHLAATAAGAVVTVTAPAGADGNGVELLTAYGSLYGALVQTQIYPTGASGSPPPSGLAAKLTGGIDPTSQHYHLDFTALGLGSCRKIWLTLAPPLNYDSGDVNPSLVAFAPLEFSAVFSNWTVVDAGNVTPLKIAGPGSVTIGNRDAWTSYTGNGWAQVAGFYFQGFARESSHAGDKVTVAYSCQHAHNLYLGTSALSTNGQFSVSVDNGAAVTVSCYALESAAIAVRRLIASEVAAGIHLVTFTVAAGAHGTTCLFDYLQAAVLSDPVGPSVVYPKLNAACDYDTDQTYKIPPSRALWVLSQMGLQGDLDFYAGVFFALKRVRNGGHFRKATVTLSGTIGTGTGWGDGDIVWITVGGSTADPPNAGTVISGATTTGGNPTGGSALGGTVFGAAAYPMDTFATLAQRLVNAINGLFVGICAAPTSTPGQATITVLSPINGFSLDVSLSAGASVTLAVSGDIGTTGMVGGNEGTWSVDASQASPPLNRAFSDYLADFAAQVHALGQTLTVAFSQELLGPPDANTSAGAWSQRFADGTTVLTDTGFGSWGAGVVEALAAGVYQQTGHGYITGNAAGFASATQSGIWTLVVVDADHYTLGTEIANSGGYTPAVGDSVLIGLQTSQCTFNPATVTAYLSKCYVQAANILQTAGLVPWLQFGEVGWWFYSERMSQPVGYASWTAPISIGTPNPHGFASGQRGIIAGVKGNTAANGTWPIVVTDSTHFTLTGSNGNGTYIGGTGTASGGGMALYDAWAAATHPLASYWTQDDVCTSSDATWLAGAIAAHVAAIAAAVLAVQSGAKFELLYPQDVNASECYYTDDLPYPQGGRLNAAMNLPAAWRAKTGSGLDRLKVEGLSWGSTYRNLDQARKAMAFAATAPCSWPANSVAYLIPIFNGGCPWKAEYLAALGVALVNLWAADHTVLLDLAVPMPVAGVAAVVE